MDKQPQENIFDNFFEHSNDLLCIADKDGRFIKLNPEWEKTLGYTIPEMEGKSYFDFIHPDDIKKTENVSIDLANNEEVKDFTNRYMHKDGSFRWLKWRSFPDEEKIYASARDITQEKQTKEDLKKKQTHLNNAISMAKIGYWEYDIAKDLFTFNDHFYKVYRTSAEKVGGYQMSSAKYAKLMMHPEDASLVYHETKKAIEADDPGFIGYVEHRIIFPDGEIGHVAVRFSIIKNEKGETIGTIGTNQDITKRKQYEEALEKRVIALTLPIEDISSIEFTDLFNLDDLQKLQDAFSNAAGVASLITYPDGTPITKASNFCSLCSLIRSTEKGRSNCKASDALIGRQNMGGAIVQPCASGGLWDAGASITLGGQHVANWLIGQVKNDALDEEEILKYADEIGVDKELYKKELGKVKQMTTEQFKKVSESLFVLANELSLKAYQNVQQARFISEKKKNENDLINALEKAELSNKLKEAFLQNVSHEIRTPLNAIVGFSGLIKAQIAEDPKIIENYTDIIEASSEQLLSIVEDILTTAKIHSGEEAIVYSTFDVNDLFDNLYSIFFRFAKGKDISLNFEKGHKDTPLMIKTDKTKLTQILTNLLNNAIKYTAQGYVGLKYKIKRDTIVFTVKDSGIGIAKENIGVIFERFSQASPEIHVNYGGNGLGLSISKSFAEMLGGKIKVKSELGKGSEFILKLPYSLGKQPVDKKVHKSKLDFKRQLKIIVAEDELNNYLLLETIFNDPNIETLHAKNGQQVLELFYGNPDTDLILMDIKMPLKDGLKATKEIREKNPKVPIIAQTAYTSDQDKQNAFKAGCNDFIAKPIKYEKLIKKIKKVLGT